ncbi:hypothetical protein LL037_13350 [Clostridium estertheticum]|uniref:hypothetical protein n=1 Tax=Clostridium estertheticum TaxID=238834 RepID=UPI001C0E04B3|nr:hypothetical protein [Clostridium estertheticum]MBU3201472.1 hypothetical protein [Clostridium estertheticum]WAG63475.1 hypothetical protein LL037_13350 [Clostridium estertheticum]
MILSLDENERILIYRAIENEIKYAALINAQYLLSHFPKPMVINEKLDGEKCGFDSKSKIFLKDMAKYTYLLHLSNIQVTTDKIQNSKLTTLDASEDRGLLCTKIYEGVII